MKFVIGQEIFVMTNEGSQWSRMMIDQIEEDEQKQRRICIKKGKHERYESALELTNRQNDIPADNHIRN